VSPNSDAADRLDVIDVCTRLHWCVDHRDWDALDELLDERVSFPTPVESQRPDFDPSHYVRNRSEVKASYPELLAGLTTQHLITGHRVELDGDRAVCHAHSVNVHVPEADPTRLVLHGNEYRFELRRTESGWRIVARQTRIVWRNGDESDYDVDVRLRRWAADLPPHRFP
jgi:3-phenylpropionate/cinnamic acid dioxygenase small subunit